MPSSDPAPPKLCSPVGTFDVDNKTGVHAVEPEQESHSYEVDQETRDKLRERSPENYDFLIEFSKKPGSGISFNPGSEEERQILRKTKPRLINRIRMLLFG